MRQLPPEIWDHICWMIDSIAQLKAIRLVSTQFARSGLAPLFHTVWVYPSIFSFDKLDAIISREDLAKLVRKFEYSADMFRFYPNWLNSFDEWKNEAASGKYLRYREWDHWKPSKQFTGEELVECHAEWKRMVEGQGSIIGSLNRWMLEADDISQRPAQEVSRLVACLQRLPNLKRVQWACDYSRRINYLSAMQQNVSKAPLFRDLPEHERNTLVPRDSTGSKYRHGKQVRHLLEALHQARMSAEGSGTISELVLSELKPSIVSSVFLQDNTQWLGPALSSIRILHLQIGTRDHDMPVRHSDRNILRCRDGIIKCLSSTVHLEKLKLHFPSLYMSKGLVEALPPTLKELSIRHSCCTEMGWKHLSAKLENLEKLNIFSSCFIIPPAFEQSYNMEDHPWSRLFKFLMSTTNIRHIRLQGSLYLRQWPRERVVFLSSLEEDGFQENDYEMGEVEYEFEEDGEAEDEESDFAPSSEEEEDDEEEEEEEEEGQEGDEEEDVELANSVSTIAEQELDHIVFVGLDDIVVNGHGSRRAHDLVRDIKRHDSVKRNQLVNSITRPGWNVEYFPSALRGHSAGEIFLTRDLNPVEFAL